MSDYIKGLKHGYEDAHKAIREILAEDIPDAEKLKWIGWRVAGGDDTVRAETRVLSACASPRSSHGDGRGCEDDTCPRHGGF